MPLEAPRFTPGGVRVGNMPTPQVRPDTGTADALNAIGGAIAQTGKAAQNISDTIADRDEKAQREADRQKALEKAKAEAQRVQDETAGQDAAKRWHVDATERYAAFTRQAAGNKVAEELASFNSYLDEPDEKYTQGLSTGAAAALKKRKDFETYAFRASSRSHAAGKVQQFTVETANVEITDSAASAANALLNRDTAAYNASLGRAISAAQRRDAITGAETKPEEIQSVVLHSAATDLRKREDHRGLVQFYDENKGKFGAREAEVRTLTQDSMDAVAAEDVMTAALPGARDANGNLDGKMLHDSLIAESEKYRVAGELPSANAQHKAMMLADKAMKADEELRKDISRKYLDSLEAALQMDDMTRFKADANLQQASKRLTDEAASTAKWKLDNGPNKSNPNIIQVLDYGRNSPVGSSPYMLWLNKDVSLLPITQDEKRRQRELQQKAKQEGTDSIDQKVSGVVKEIWERGGLRALPNVAPGKEATEEQAKQIADFNAMRDAVTKKLAEEVAADRANAGNTADIRTVAAKWVNAEAQSPKSTWYGWDRVSRPLYQDPASTLGKLIALPSAEERARLNLPANAPTGMVQNAVVNQRIMDDAKKKAQAEEREAAKQAAYGKTTVTPDLGFTPPEDRFEIYNQWATPR